MRPGFFKQGKETIMKGRFNSSIYSSIHHLSIYNIHSFINVSKKLTNSMKVLRSLCVCKCSGPSVCVCVCVCVCVFLSGLNLSGSTTLLPPRGLQTTLQVSVNCLVLILRCCVNTALSCVLISSG